MSRARLFSLLFIVSIIVMTTPQISAIGEGWLTGWNYRKSVHITGAVGCGVDYQIMLNVTYLPDMQTDFVDIRFTDNDGTTLLDYWLESKTDSAYAYFWVEVADSLEGNVTIYMYYGNSSVSSLSNGAHTFPFFDSFDDASINTTLWYNWFTGGSSTESGGNLVVTGGDGETETQGGKFKFGTSYAYEYKVRFANDDQNYEALGFDDRSDNSFPEGEGVDALEIIYSEGRYYRIQDEGSSTNEARTQDYSSWGRVSLRRSAVSVLVYRDDSLEKNLTSDVPQDDCGVWVYVRQLGSSVILDFTFVRKYVFGVSYVIGEWTIINIAQIIFDVALDMWGMDTAIIILGLVMIPVSTLYLAYGIKNDRSSDRLFYGLIIFFIGCGLFIGGVLP